MFNFLSSFIRFWFDLRKDHYENEKEKRELGVDQRRCWPKMMSRSGWFFGERNNFRENKFFFKRKKRKMKMEKLYRSQNR